MKTGRYPSQAKATNRRRLIEKLMNVPLDADGDVFEVKYIGYPMLYAFISDINPPRYFDVTMEDKTVERVTHIGTSVMHRFQPLGASKITYKER